MSADIHQIYVSNPITVNASTDLMYFGQAPYTAFSNNAAMTFANFAAQFGTPYTASSLTVSSDPNITLTLGGTPATALLQPTSITVSWSGLLPLNRGGTNASLTASNGGIVWSNASQFQILAGTTTANQVLLSGNLSAPTWSTATYPVTTTINRILYSSANNVISEIPTSNDSTLITSSLGVPSMSQTLPTTVQGNITEVGTVNIGTWNATIISPQFGGTGVNNGSSTFTIGGNTSFTGAFTFNGNLTGNTNVTFPTSGTLLTTATFSITGTANQILVTGSAPTYTIGFTSVLHTVNGNVLDDGTSAVTLSNSGSNTSQIGRGTYTGALQLGGNSIDVTANSTGGVSIGNALNSVYIGSQSTANSIVNIQPGTGSNATNICATAGYSGTLTIGNSSIAAINLLGTTNINTSGSSAINIGTGTYSGTITIGNASATLHLSTVSAGVWQGTPIALAYGGTNASLTASNGGIVWCNASQFQILSGTATANQILLSGSTASPAWSTATYPATTTINQLLYSSASNTITGLPTANNGVLVTSSSGVPSISSTLPTAVQLNITEVGTITTGTWNGNPIDSFHGGTGLGSPSPGQMLIGSGSTGFYAFIPAPSGFQILGTDVLGGVFWLSTLPVVVQSNITQVGTITSGVWNGTVIAPQYGGTGVNNGTSTFTIGGNTSFTGAFTFNGNLTGNTNVTFPTSGTLATSSNVTGANFVSYTYFGGL